MPTGKEGRERIKTWTKREMMAVALLTDHVEWRKGQGLLWHYGIIIRSLKDKV